MKTKISTRLYLSGMALQGILSNETMRQTIIREYKSRDNKANAWDSLVLCSISYADNLIYQESLTSDSDYEL